MNGVRAERDSGSSEGYVWKSRQRVGVKKVEDLPEMQLKGDECFDDLDIGESKKVKKICRAFVANSRWMQQSGGED